MNDPSVTSVTFLNDEIDDLEFLRGNTFVRDVCIINCKNVKSLEPLENNTTVTTLRVSGCGIEDISPLRGNCTIRNLSLSENPIVDVSPIESMTSVTWLTIYGCKIQNADPIFRNRSIMLVDIDDNHVTTIDLIRFNTTLDTLYIRNNHIPDEHKLLVLNNAYLTDVAFGDDDDSVFWPHLELNQDNLYNRRFTLKNLSLHHLPTSKSLHTTHNSEKVDY